MENGNQFGMRGQPIVFVGGPKDGMHMHFHEPVVKCIKFPVDKEDNDNMPSYKFDRAAMQYKFVGYIDA